ncbi:MAG: cyclodeaminase/cyclohydrolase family protein [Oscillospiraceae bacterium]|nr:cyclodeaminase/cyclohydrolase family protein [Oscillospiraceae bacterium]
MSYIETMGKILDYNDLEVAGGASAALSGAMAASIAAMASRLSMKKDFGLSVDELDEIITEAEELSHALQDGADKDVIAFHSVIEAFALPKATEEDIEARKAALQKGYVLAAMAPRDNARYSVRVKSLLDRMYGKTNPACHSDVAVARALCEVAIAGCMLNIKANIDYIKDEDTKAGLRKDIDFFVGNISFLDVEKL